ncbi:cupin domain-containing protein [Haliea sp. E17]|uniref:cupin domain-containing protein n=1 Tax=Haliea sp. E17 TaxID=3401576 RepID=UPI003AAF4865
MTRLEHFETGNIFDEPDVVEVGETFIDLIRGADVRLEKIISRGHCTPPGEWYDQEESEWVIVLKGEARIGYPDGASVELKEGDYLNIPAHTQHRVDWTATSGPTIWLAVFYRPVAPGLEPSA